MDTSTSCVIPSKNPLNIGLILDKILSYLPRKHLLTCRLVNSSWDFKALEILQQRGCSITLDGSNMKEYLGQLCRYRASKDDSETDSKSDYIPAPTTRLNYSVVYGKNLNSLNNIVQGTRELVEFLGPDCVQSFTYHCVVSSDVENIDYNTEWIRVLKLIQHISLGLQRLYIHFQIAEGEVFASSEITFVDPSFPELTTFHYSEAHVNPIIIAQITNSAPKLTSFEIMKRLFDDGNGPRISRELNSINSLAHLHELQVDAANFINTGFAHLEFDHLRKLILRIETGVYEISTEFIGSLIKEKFNRLTSLEFEFIPSCYSLLNEFPIDIPTLPNLTHFGYYVNWRHCFHQDPSFIKIDNLLSPPRKFLNLHSIRTNFGSCMYLSTAEPVQFPIYQEADQRYHFSPWYDPSNIGHIQFTTVSTLHFNFNYDIDFTYRPNGIGFPITLKESINQLHVLYPNLRKLFVDMMMYSGSYEIARATLKSILEELVGVEQLEISNYYNDWLSEVFTSVSNFGGGDWKVQNLKVIRFPSLRKYKSYPYVDLGNLLHHMPNLELIQLDAEFVQKIEQTSEVRFELTKYEAAFPKLKIQLL